MTDNKSENPSEYSDIQESASFQRNLPENEEAPKSLFTSGSFVIALIIFGLFVALITWSVSFLAMLFGAIGALVSIASQYLLNNEKFDFVPACDKCRSISDENYAYLLARAVLGMIFGTGVFLIVYNSIEPHWSHIAALSLFGGLVFDRLLFRKNK